MFTEAITVNGPVNETENYQIRFRKAKCIVILALCDDCR